MSMIKKLIFLFFISGSLSAQSLDGIWFITDKPNKSQLVLKEFSWGKGYSVINGSIDIDLINKVIEVGLFGSFIVKNYQVLSDTVILSVFGINSNLEFEMIIHFISSDQFWIEPIENISMFPTGPESIYYRIDGPAFK